MHVVAELGSFSAYRLGLLSRDVVRTNALGLDGGDQGTINNLGQCFQRLVNHPEAVARQSFVLRRMMLATLTVVGTLLSDLALAVLDPRIRFGDPEAS